MQPGDTTGDTKVINVFAASLGLHNRDQKTQNV